MGRAKACVICGGIVGLTASYGAGRGDLLFAAPMFVVAAFFAAKANREWKRAG